MTGPDFGTHSVGPLQLQLTADSGAPPYTWSVTGGTLPGGVALRSDVPQWFPPDSAALSGVTTAPGTHNFTLTVTDSNNASDSRAFTLTVTSLTVVNDFTLPDAFVGETYGFAFTLAGASGAATIAENPCCGALPPGLSIDANGHLTGQPTQSGGFNINIAVTDGSTTIYRGFNLTVFGVHIMTAGTLPNAQHGTLYTTTLMASGGTGPYTWQSSNLPGGFTLASDGTLSAPSPQQGMHFFTATVTDSAMQSHSRNFMVAVLGGTPTLPELNTQVPLDDLTIGEQRSMSFWVNGGVPPYTWAVNGLPPQLALALRPADANSFQWPNQAELGGVALATGEYSFSISVTDSSTTPITVTRTLTLEVSELTFDHPNFNATLNTFFSTALRVYGGTGSSHTGTFLTAGSALPTGVSFNGTPPTFSGMPREWGGYHIRLLLDDGDGHTLNRSLHLHVNGGGSNVNIGTFHELPDATHNQLYTFNLWSCCAPNVAWSVEAGSALPTGLTLAANQINGTPSVSGNHAFRIRATNADNPADFVVREFQLHVTPVVITSSFNLPFGNKDTAYPPPPPNSYTLTATGGAVDFIWEVPENSALPPGLSLNLSNGIWTLSGTPTSAGRFSFNLRVRDQAGNSRTGWFSLEIYPAGATPPVTFAMGSHFGTFPLGAIELGLHASGGDGNYVWSAVNELDLPPGMKVRTDPAPWFPPNTKGALSGVATQAGTYTFELRVTSAGQDITQQFTIEITTLNALDPCCSLPDVFESENFSYRFTSTRGASTSWSFQPNTIPPPPAWLTIDPDGTLHGTPPAGTAANYQVSLRLSDGPDAVHRTFNLLVSDIKITNDDLLFVTAGGLVNNNIQFTASPPSGNYVWSAAGLSGGLSMSSNGLLSGTLTHLGTQYVNVTVTNTTTSRFYTKRVTLNGLSDVPGLPSLQSIDFNDWTVGQPQSIVFTASGGQAPYAWSIQNQPTGTELRTTGMSPWTFPQQAELFGIIPTAGTYTFTVSMTDSSSPPITVVREYVLRASELMMNGFGPIPLTFGYTNPPMPIRVIGGDLGYQFEIVSGKLPAGMSLSTAGVLDGTPQETGGTHAVLRITDGAGRELRTGFGLFVSGGPNNTVQINSHYELTATEDQFFSQTLFACCLANGYSWDGEPSGSALPAGLTISSSGVLSGTPSEPGQFTFRVRVFDPTFAANFAVRQFVLTVTPVSYTSATNLPHGNVNTPYTHTLANPNGPSGTPSWIVAPGSALPLGLNLVEVSPGDWRITGTPQYAGQYQFNLIASKGGFSRSVFFQLPIFPEGANPPLNLPISGMFGPFRLGRVHVTLSAQNGEPPYTFEYEPGYEISGVRVQDADEPQPVNTTPGAASLLGVIAEPGSYTTRVRVTDSANASIVRELTIVVSPIVITTNFQMPDGAMDVPYMQTLSAVGGDGSYEWSLSGGGALPSGLTLGTNGAISGTPTTTGTFNFNVRANDGAVSFTQNLRITIPPFAITTNAVLPVATQGTAYSVSLSANCQCTWNLVGGGLTSGLTLSSAGVISGTPISFGTTTFTISGRAGSITSQKIFTLHVRPNTPQPIRILTTTLAQTTIGQQYTASFFATGGVAPYTWTLVSGELPPGLQLQDGSLVSNNTPAGVLHLAGVPTALGPYTFTVEVTDSVGAPASAVFSVLVSPIGIEYRNLPLALNTLKYNTPYQQRMLAIGGSGAYSWAPVGEILPGVSLAATDLVSGTPLNTGFFNVPIQVTDTIGLDALTQNVSFNIVSASGATLTINNGPNLGVFQQGSINSIGLSAFGGPSSPPRVFTFSVAPTSTLPAGFALLSGDSFPGGPGAPGATQLAFTALETGTFTFTLEVRDQDLNFGAKTMTVTISPFTIFTSTLPDASAGVPYTQPLHAWGAGGTWSVATGSALPAGLNLAGAVLSGTPLAAGNYSFVLRVCDAASICVSRLFTLRVSTIALTDAAVLPVATAGTVFSYSFTATGGGNPKTFTIVPPPQGGQSLPANFALSTGGVLSGTTGDVGSFTFTVAVTDGASTMARTFTLHVADPNPILLSPTPSAGIDTRYITVGQSFSYVPPVRGGTPPYTWALTGGTLPSGLTLYSGANIPSNNAPGSTVLAGAPTVAGTSTLYLTATDADGAQTTLRLTLIVAPVSLVQNSLRGAVYGVEYRQQLVAAGGTGSYTAFELVEETVLPAGLSLSSTGLISGTPTDTGNFNFQVEVTDSAGSKFRRTYGIFVRASATANGLNLSPATINDVSVGTGMALTLRANGAANTNITWSLKAGSALPAGLDLLWGATLPQGFPAGSAVLLGVPTEPGLQAFTLQATDGALNFGERRFTMHVSPMQIVSLAGLRDATVGTAYLSDPMVIAGGTLPRSVQLAPFINNAAPPGLILRNDGVLEGSPSVPGNFVFTVRIVDASGLRLQRTVSLNVVAAGNVSPLFLSANRLLSDASVGVPLAFPLDVRAFGGMKPYTWSVGAGLPDGVTLVAGSGPNSAHLVGAPTTVGPHTFTLTVSDAAGQSVSGSFSMNVSALRLSPELLATATVGTLYTPPPLTVTGGTGPYTIATSIGSALPSDLTRTIGATTVTLSGTPTVQGRFGMGFTVADSGGATLSRGVVVNVDSPASPTPYVALNPTGVQITYVQGGTLPAPFPVDITSSSTALSFTAMLAGLPTGTLSLTTGTTPRTTNIVFSDATALNGLAAGVYRGVLSLSAPGSVNLIGAIPVTLTVAPPPPCAYTLGATSATFSDATHAGNLLPVTTNNSLCTWTAASNATWLEVHTPSGVGNGSVLYTVHQNTNAAQRTATITVEDKSFTVTQFGTTCSVVLGPSSINAPAGESNNTVLVNASASDCSWTATASAPWIQITPSSETGMGSEPISFTVLATGDPAPRTATIDLSGMVTATINITQTGLDCTVTLSDSSASIPANGGPGMVTVTSAPCGYTTVAPPQVTITSGGSSPGPDVNFTVAQNSSTQPRNLTMYIGGHPFYIEQPGVTCNLTIGGSNPLFGAGGGAGSITIGAPAATCDWSASSGATWVTITQGTTGAGDGTVAFSVAQNPDITPRSTTIAVAGTTVQINQDGTACSFSLRATNGTVPVIGGAGSVGVVALTGCAWTATSNAGWLAITDSPDTGTGDVSFLASTNPTASPRTGTLTIAGHTYPVTQPGAPCTFTLSSASAIASAGGDTGSFTFSTPTEGCTAPVQSYNSWISVSSTFAGTSGTVDFTVQPNPFVIDRTGRILVGDQTFTITQSRAISCSYSLHAPSATFSAVGGFGDVLATATDNECEPGIGASPEITLGMLTLPTVELPLFRQHYTVQPFVTSVVWVRTLSINFGGVTFAVKQTSW